jgi:hypothetical protein
MNSDGTVKCSANPRGDCAVSKLWETIEPTEFHPRQLMEATQKIQGILDQVVKSNQDAERHLAIIIYDYRPLLAWTQDAVSPEDDVRCPESPQAAYEMTRRAQTPSFLGQ